MIEKRKADHLKLCVDEEVGATWNHWDDIQLVHSALPSGDLDQIDLSTTLFGRKLSAPIVIAAMTGGHPMAEKINKNLATAAQEHRVGMGVGSQRAALEKPELERTYSVIRNYEIPLVLGNLGAPQLLDPAGKYGVEEAKKAMEMIGAHVLAVHLNYLQEAVQPEGDTFATGLVPAMSELCKSVPVVAKETGAGMTRKNAMSFKNMGAVGLDVGGSGGTSFAAVEVYRAREIGDEHRERLGELLWNWGIPTPVSVLEARDSGLPIIATGGIRSGIDILRSLALGANSAGVARFLLEPAMKGPKETSAALDILIKELRAAMFITQSLNIEGARTVPWFAFEPARTWLTALGHKSSRNTM